jgi:hypothetical protein
VPDSAATISIGRLRWPVRLIQRAQIAPAAPATGITETPADPRGAAGFRYAEV